MFPSTSSFRQYANSIQNHVESSDPSSTKELAKTKGIEDHTVSIAQLPLSTPATSSTDTESPKLFPERLPHRIPARSLWTRLLRNNRCRIVIGVFCFSVVIGGTVVGAFFLANIMRTGIFHPGSGATTRDATRTVHVTATSVVRELGKEMGLVTKTVWSMQETHAVTQWVVVLPKTTMISASPTTPTTKS